MKRKPQELFEVNLMTPVRILEESKGPDKLLTITGVAGRADVKTANGRVYTESCYIATADRAQPRLLTNKLLGQIEHPDKKPMGTLDRVCTRFTKLWVEDKELRYEAVVLPTPSGEILRGLLVGGVNVGNSTRGSGTVMKGSAYRPQDRPQIIGDIVQDDYELFGIDFVADESNEYGRVTHYESREGGNDDMTLKELQEKYPDLLKEHRELVVTELKESVTTEVKSTLTEEFNTKLQKDIEEAKTQVRATVEAELKESTEYKQATEILEKAKEIFGPVIGIKEVVKEDKEARDQVTVLTESVSAKDTEITALKQQVQLLESKETERTNKEKVAAHIETKIKGHKFGALIKERLLESKTVEEVDAKFDSEVKFVEKVAGSRSGQLPAGSGYMQESRDQNDPDKDEQAKLRQKKLAGLA